MKKFIIIILALFTESISPAEAIVAVHPKCIQLDIKFGKYDNAREIYRCYDKEQICTYSRVEYGYSVSCIKN